MACRFHFLNENFLDFFGDDDDDDAIALQYNDREIHPHSEHFMCIFNRWALQGPLDFNRCFRKKTPLY